MKKKLIVALMLVMLLFASITTNAATWASTPTQTASPFAVEVIKLKANIDATGSRYYTVTDTYAQNGNDIIYYAVKLTLPSYADANAYYGTKDLVSGSSVKVTINYTNVSNKTKDVVYAKLTDRQQTLWYDGDEFIPYWYGQYALEGMQTHDTTAKITASIIGKGTLADISIGNDYKVKKQEYFGARPCVNCNAVNLAGYLVYSASSAYDVFLFTANNKLVGVYVVDRNQLVGYDGAKVLIGQKLYEWAVVGAYMSGGVNCYKWGFEELYQGTSYNKNGTLNHPITSDGNFGKFCDDFKVDSSLRDLTGVYYSDVDGIYHRVNGAESFWPTTTPYYFKGADNAYYEYADTTDLRYGNVYYAVGAYVDDAIHQMVSANLVNGDGADKAYLNSANYVLNMLGLSFVDIGNAYMSDDLWLQNFGFKADITSTADWGYATSIVTVPIAEVPATGNKSMTLTLVVILSVTFAVAYWLVKPKPKR